MLILMFIGYIVLVLGGRYLLWKLTNNFYQKLFKMANQRGCATQFETIVRCEKYTHPDDLYGAYQEAIHSNLT